MTTIDQVSFSRGKCLLQLVHIHLTQTITKGALTWLQSIKQVTKCLQSRVPLEQKVSFTSCPQTVVKDVFFTWLQSITEVSRWLQLIKQGSLWAAIDLATESMAAIDQAGESIAAIDQSSGMMAAVD